MISVGARTASENASPVSYIRDMYTGSTPRERWTLAGLVLLITGVSIDRFGIDIRGIDFRIELILGVLVALVWALRTGIQGLVTSVRSARLVEVCLVAWLCVGFISSLLFSPMRADSLKLTVLEAGFVILYGVGFVLLRTTKILLWAAHVWIAIGTAVALIGLGCALVYTFAGGTAGVTLEGNYQDGFYSVVPKVHSTLWEPNLFGSYCLAVGIPALALSLSPEYGSRGWQLWLRFAVVSTFCGVMLSMTRTLWLVMPCVLGLFVAVCLWRKVANLRTAMLRLLLPALLGSLLGLGVGIAMPSVSVPAAGALSAAQQQVVIDQAQHRASTPAVPGTPGATGAVPTPDVSQKSAITERVGTLSDPSQISSLVGRKRIFLLAFQGFLQRPVLGWGTGSFAAYDTGDDKWIGNLELHVLFDTGLVGFLVLAVAVFVTLRDGLRALVAPIGQWSPLHYMILGLLVGGVGLVLAFQTTEGMWLGFTWVYFIMLVAFGRQALSPVAASEVPERAQAANEPSLSNMATPELQPQPVHSR